MARTPEVAAATSGESRSHMIFRSAPWRSAHSDFPASSGMLLVACALLTTLLIRLCGRYMNSAAAKDATATDMPIAMVHKGVAGRFAEPGSPFAAGGGKLERELGDGSRGAGGTTAAAPVLLTRCAASSVFRRSSRRSLVCWPTLPS